MEQREPEQPIPTQESLPESLELVTTHASPENLTATELAAKIEEVELKDKSRLARLRESLGLAAQGLKQGLKNWIESDQPKYNIKFYPDRMYRCIGPKGYEQFRETGLIRSKNRRVYNDVSFNEGRPAPLYAKGKSGEYILEATPDSTTFHFKTHPWNAEPMTDIDYRGCEDGALTKDSKIRIFERVDDKKYKVVFDNIRDQALVDEE